MTFPNINNDQAFMWAYKFNVDGSNILDSSDISVNNSNEIQWVHVCYDATDAIEQLQSFDLDSSVIEALTADETRPRTISLNEGILMVLRGINTNHNADPEDMISVRIWFTKNFVITTRRMGRKLFSIDQIRQTFIQPNQPIDTGDFVTLLVEKLADEIGKMVDVIDEELTIFETNMIDIPQTEMRTRLATTRRQTASIRRYLAPQRDALESLNRMQAILSDENTFDLRQQTDRTMRYVEDLDLARERAIFLQEELRNKISEQQNKRMYVLSIVTAIFLPLSFLTGVFGMNVGGLPGTENGDAFLILLSTMSLLALAITGIMYWKKWV
jgi:zinc transporter